MSEDSVYFSYSKDDAHIAKELAETLISKGAKVWIDSIELVNLQSGQDEEELIEKAILSAKLIAIVTSPNALNDTLLKDEKQFARDNGKEVILLKIADCNVDKKMRWRRLPCIDFTKNKELGIETLLQKVGISNTINATQNNPKPIHDNAVEEVKREPVIKEESVISSTEPSKTNALAGLIQELRDDIDLSEVALNNQIKKSRLGVGLLITCSVLLLLGLYLIPGLKEFLATGEDNLKYLSPIGGMIPSSLSTLSINKIKEKKKRLSSLNICDRKLSRMEKGLVEFTKKDVLGLEDEVFSYINA